MEFINYVKSFYSMNGGIYGAEYGWSDPLIEAMCLVRCEMADFCGDSIDREWVRDMLLSLDKQVVFSYGI